MFTESDITFDIIDYSGKIVKTQKVYSQTELNTVNINLNDVANGIYAIRIYNQNSIIVKRFSVAK